MLSFSYITIAICIRHENVESKAPQCSQQQQPTASSLGHIRGLGGCDPTLTNEFFAPLIMLLEHRDFARIESLFENN